MAEKDKGKAQPRNHALTAALLGGAAAAAAGAVLSARAIARRNGKPLNSVMETAATACELAHGPGASSCEPSTPREPKPAREPKVG